MIKPFRFPSDETLKKAADESAAPPSMVAPRILLGPTNTSSFLDRRLELRCSAEGVPPPRITWESRRDGKLPTVGNQHRVHKNGSLIFRSVSKTDQSWYRCTAANEAGSQDSPYAQLVIEGEAQD